MDMDKDEVTQSSDDSPADAPDRDQRTTPRGNQEAEREWVERGEEQLEKVSGN